MKILLETGLANLDSRTLILGEKRTRLSRIDAILLRYLASRPKETISREELYKNVWKYKGRLQTRTLDLAMSRLRKKVERDTQQPVHLLTVYGSGYAFIPLGQDTGDIALPTSTPSRASTNLESDPTLFVGRNEAMRLLTTLCQNPQRFTTVLGPPGIGKTRLVKHWAAQQVNNKTFDSLWFCDLSEAQTNLEVLQAVASGLCTPITEKEESVLVLTRQLGYGIVDRGSTCIILDNVEQVVEQVSQIVAQWCDQSPEATFILTSQVPLGLAMEQRLPLNPLPVPTETTLDQENPAIQLFADRAKAVKPDFAFSSDNMTEIIRILAALDGLPLAIELAATRLHLMSPAMLHQKLEQRFRLLRRHKRAGPARHSTLYEAISWSWELLQPWEQSALAQCSVFRGGFDWEAVESVICLDDIPSAPWNVDVVAELVERSLVHVQEIGSGGVRLSLLVSIHAFAAEKLAERLESTQTLAHQRHATYYSNLRPAGSTSDPLNTLYSSETIAPGTLEFKNVAVAIERCLENDWLGEVKGLWYKASAHLRNRGPVSRMQSLLESILDKRIDPAFEARLWGDMCLTKRDLGHREEAHSYALKALQRHQELDDFAGECVALRRLGRFLLLDGQMESARERLLQALAAAEKVDSRDDLLARIYIEIGNVNLQTAQWDCAMEYYQKALMVFEELNSAHLLCKGHAGIGFLHLLQDQLDEAEQHLTVALALANESDVAHLRAYVLTNLGKLRLKQGRPDIAAPHFNEALTLCFDSWPILQANCQSHLALLQARDGNLDQAAVLLKQAEPNLANMHATEYGKFLCIRAEVALIAGNPSEAREDIDKATTLSIGPNTELGREVLRLEHQFQQEP